MASDSESSFCGSLLESNSQFLSLLLDNIPQEIVVINTCGEIQFINKSWISFGEENNGSKQNWLGVNYLEECQRAVSRGDRFAASAKNGIDKVISGKTISFSFEYPCHTSEDSRWFTMHVAPINIDTCQYFIISHYDITQRKKAEEEVLNLSKLDPLTCIPNRRSLNEFLETEWRRCARDNTLLAYALIDIDYFKLINDTYGHQTGDQYLSTIAQQLPSVCSRPSDICGRYGGEEFAIIWSGISSEKAQQMCTTLVEKIDALQIPNSRAPIYKHLTISSGLATMTPKPEIKPQTIITLADSQLYQAKQEGRNRVVTKSYTVFNNEITPYNHYELMPL